MTTTTIPTKYHDRRLTVTKYSGLTKQVEITIATVNSHSQRQGSELAWVDADGARELVAALTEAFGAEALKPLTETEIARRDSQKFWDNLPVGGYFTITHRTTGGKYFVKKMGSDRYSFGGSPAELETRVTRGWTSRLDLITASWNFEPWSPPKPSPAEQFNKLAVGDQFTITYPGGVSVTRAVKIDAEQFYSYTTKMIRNIAVTFGSSATITKN